MNFDNFSQRRDFLRMVAAASTAGALSAAETLSNIAQAAVPIENEPAEVAADYKAIVCVFLYGGQDYANLLVPYQDSPSGGQNEYSCYAAARSYGGASQSESGANLSFARSRLGEAGETRVVSSADTPNMPAGFTTNVFGRKFAWSPDLPEMAYHYKQKKLAVIANTGLLVAPINRHVWYNRGALKPALPAALYSHGEGQKSTMSGRANLKFVIDGIGGRIAEEVVALNGTSAFPMSISVSGSSTFLLSRSSAVIPVQVGSGNIGRVQVSGTPPSTTCNQTATYISANPTQPYCFSGGLVAVNTGYAQNKGLFDTFSARLRSAQNAPNIYLDQWGDIMDQSIRTEKLVAAALLSNPLNEDTVKPFREYVPSSNPAAVPIDVVNPPASDAAPGTNLLASQLRTVAALIRATAAVDAKSATSPMKRQVFFVSLGGFDTHSEFWRSNKRLNLQLDRSLDAFWQALGNIKIQGSTTRTGQDAVTLFTMSDFGRTLDSNGSGSDHGWGGHHFVLGGAVKGGLIYGANHNVATADIPNDQAPSANGGKSRFMVEDLTAGAFPRIGIPPLSYDSTQGSTAPGGKARMLIPGTTAQYLPLNHALDRGDLLPTMASDAYVATIARWFGVSADRLATVFPTVTSAHPTFDTTRGVGFMTIA